MRRAATPRALDSRPRTQPMQVDALLDARRREEREGLLRPREQDRQHVEGQLGKEEAADVAEMDARVVVVAHLAASDAYVLNTPT